MPTVEQTYLAKVGRTLRSTSGTWASARTGAGLQVNDNFCQTDSLLGAGCQLTASYFLHRSMLFLPNLTATNVDYAKLYIYVTEHGVTGDIHLTRGVQDYPVTVGDWVGQTTQVTSGGSIAATDLVDNQYNAITLNATGIGWLNQDGVIPHEEEGYSGNPTAYADVYGTIKWSMSFTPVVSHTVTKIALQMFRVGDAGTVTFNLKAADADHQPTGEALATATKTATEVTTSTPGSWYTLTLSEGVALTAGSKYCIEVLTSGGDETNKIRLRAQSAGVYANGRSAYYNGTSWATQTEGWDIFFAEYAADYAGNGTLLCLKGSHDLNDSAPPVVSNGVIAFSSPQSGVTQAPYLEISRVASVYPTDATTRVTSITHRYNRGVYNMELGLGEVVSDFGIPHVDTRTEESYDRGIVPPYFKPGWRPPEEPRLPQKPATEQYIPPVSPPAPKLQAQATPYERPVGMVERAARAGRAVVGFAEKQKAGMERTFEWMFGRFF